jgi:glycosyltransferase involved in cell wall biosynthesis
VGTIGMAAALDVVLRAARDLRDRGRDDLCFLLVGDGAGRAALEERARAESLTNVIFTGRQPKARMPEFLAAADTCLVHLSRKDLFKTVLPSKIFESAATARPIVLGVEGAAAALVSGADAGLCIEPENEGALVEAVLRLADDRALGARLGGNGLRRIADQYDVERLAGEYLEILRPMVSGASQP